MDAAHQEVMALLSGLSGKVTVGTVMTPSASLVPQAVTLLKSRHARLHGLTGIVVIPSRGKPRNHGVEIAGVMYVVHAGNLRKPPEATR